MLFWICLAAPFLFLLNALVLGAGTADYSPRQNTISSLVHGNYGQLQTFNFIVCGLLILILAYITRNAAPVHVRNAYLIKIGIWVLGLSLFLLGIFPTDRVGQHTVIGQIHGAIFIVSVVIQAVLQIAFALSNLPSLVASSILVTSIITAFGLPAMMLFRDWRGLIQKVFVAAIMWWVTVGAVLLHG